MRRAAYVGASVAAAAAVVLKAFHERPNFYSATVYLGQSTACRMILLNMFLLTLAASMYGLQRLLYGPLRAIEVEQLWDKAWYAITETALAMTTFRDEVGGYFFLMFMTLLAGKVWGWIGEGRVETMEQQPPARPKTFYTRLTTSLVLSELFDLLMARYCVRSILDQRAPKAGMMIMFVFEFAILSINSASTLARYGLALWERLIVKQQTKAKIEERREELRAERALANRQRHTQTNVSGDSASSESTESIEIDENEIDVPGWQEKGKWLLFLDLTTDFLKLVFYMTFFLILILFAGLPIHMFRDLFMTTRSFLKRINDYLKYRNATRDMNTRYPDAGADELRRDGTCIICREEMRPWVGGPAHAVRNEQDQARPNRSPLDERQRPKKLPCGHILHFGCLRSWLERQQVCPTCRRSVLAPSGTGTGSSQAGTGNNNRPPIANGQAQGQNQQQHNHAPGHEHGHQQQPGAQQGHGNVPGINRMRTFNFGGYRLTFATGQGVNVRDAINQMQNQGNNGQNQSDANGVSSATLNNQQGSRAEISTQLRNIQARLVQEANDLNIAQSELQYIHAMARELERMRLMRSQNAEYVAAQSQSSHQASVQNLGANSSSSGGVEQQTLRSHPRGGLLRAGDATLPEGVRLPEGWSLQPLSRVSGSRTTMNVQVQGQFHPRFNGFAPFQNRFGAVPHANGQHVPMHHPQHPPEHESQYQPNQTQHPDDDDFAYEEEGTVPLEALADINSQAQDSVQPSAIHEQTHASTDPNIPPQVHSSQPHAQTPHDQRMHTADNTVAVTPGGVTQNSITSNPSEPFDTLNGSTSTVEDHNAQTRAQSHEQPQAGSQDVPSGTLVDKAEAQMGNEVSTSERRSPPDTTPSHEISGSRPEHFSTTYQNGSNDIPQWASSKIETSDSSTNGSANKGEERFTDLVNGPEASTNGHSKEDKGKGRAVQVEDVEDDGT